MKKFVDGAWIGLAALCCLCSCAVQDDSFNGWTPARTGPAMPALDVNDVLITNGMPSAAGKKIGHMNPPAGVTVKVSHEDRDLLQYFKQQAASMGANTVVVQNSPIRYKTGKTKGSEVSFLFVEEETGSHGGDDMNMRDDIVPINEETLRLY